MNVEYTHSENLHTLTGAEAALRFLWKDTMPASLLDVGCGIGTWLRAAQNLGVADIYGIDGVEIAEDALLIPRHLFARFDLTTRLQLGRKFAVAVCLEVAEHLPATAAEVLIATLTDHADTIYFSAACPGQAGQHHINCQWPEYWQALFNQCGFVCDDAVRWQIWDMPEIEPWYRQNLFIATKNAVKAGTESRLASVVHPAMLPSLEFTSLAQSRQQIEAGCLPLSWYISTPVRAYYAKIQRRLT